MCGRVCAQAVCIAMMMQGAATQAEAADGAVAGAPAVASNPLLAPWSGPYGGSPPFDKVRVADFKPALEAAMAENLAEIDAIAKNPAAPNFENTLAALERAGHKFNRVNALYNVWSS